MTSPVQFTLSEQSLDAIATHAGLIAVIVDPDGKMDAGARKVNTVSRKAVARFAQSPSFEKMREGDVKVLAFPTGLEACGIAIVKLSRRPDQDVARRAGGNLAKHLGEDPTLLLLGSQNKAADIVLGLGLRAYAFDVHKTADKPGVGAVEVMATKTEAIDMKAISALIEGVFFTRDLTNEPANVLTTTEFADRLAEMENIGLKVEIIEEPALKELGMGSLLSVGQGSSSPSKVAIMSWNGGGDEAPFALVGKGVVFDTGGISLKPAAGMEDMTGDMGGAGVVAGVMRSLALRGAKANVVGLVGLVENMPSGDATRPGDVVTSMKGDTIEVINTDAEGRLVLADVLWYTQERFKPTGIINLATLTGAVVVALGHENAGVFSNSDDLSGAFLNAAKSEGEGAWPMPLAPAYDKLIDSRIADIKNTGGRPAGAITAAQFLRRFVADDMPWCHLDIAGVAFGGPETDLAPKGASGWGVLALNRLISDRYEA